MFNIIDVLITSSKCKAKLQIFNWRYVFSSDRSIIVSKSDYYESSWMIVGVIFDKMFIAIGLTILQLVLLRFVPVFFFLVTMGYMIVFVLFFLNQIIIWLRQQINRRVSLFVCRPVNGNLSDTHGNKIAPKTRKLD